METVKKLLRIDEWNLSHDQLTSDYEIWTSSEKHCFSGFCSSYPFK